MSSREDHFDNQNGCSDVVNTSIPNNKRLGFVNLTVFENHRKSLIQHCEQSKLRLHSDWTKVN